jgi:hypothetical protein
MGKPENTLVIPDDFLFELTNEEFANLRSQFVTSSCVSQNAILSMQHLGGI